MEIRDKVVLVTGAARGIGRALAERFAAEQPRGLLLVDRNPVAGEYAADVANPEDVARMFDEAERRFGHVDLVCSNAGVLAEGGVDTPDSEWDRLWRVNVMSHVYVSRQMLARGGGYLLITVSAAGLLTAPGSAAYAVTKHAALGLGEWLAVEHGGRGLKVSCLCPEFVLTDMVREMEGPFRNWMVGTAIPVEHVADAVIAGLSEEKFLILPHPNVQRYFQNKAADHDRWISGMQRLLNKVATPSESA